MSYSHLVDRLSAVTVQLSSVPGAFIGGSLVYGLPQLTNIYVMSRTPVVLFVDW